LIGIELLPYQDAGSEVRNGTPSGSSAVNTCPQALQRSLSSSYTVAASGARPTIRTNAFGSFCV
jgi:hypothetical protein